VSIKVKDLVKNFGAQCAVNHINFSVNPGEIVGFLGPNGAGKSTTMKMITGYLEPDQGVIEVCDTRVETGSIQTKKQIGYLPESNALYTDLFVREYLQFVSGLHQLSNPKKAIDQVIEMVGLQKESHKKIGQLSKGYKQRVGLAAAIIHQPPVLILDEPTSGLDPNQILEIREVIRTLGKEKTVLFSSHIMQEVEALCDRVVVINQGKLMADGRITDLKKQSGESHTIFLELAEPASLEALKALLKIEEIEQLSSTGFRILTSTVKETNRMLMNWIQQENRNLVSIRTEEQSLEQIFSQLTRS
jgi:ABC-2 type transport system ATP-binding protein